MLSNVNPAFGKEPSIQLFRLLITVAAHLRTRMDQRLAEVGLTTPQAAVLTFVDVSEEPPTLGETARALGTSHQNARQVVAALERKGMMEVQSDPADGRIKRLVVTEKVAETFADRDVIDKREVAKWLSALSETEQLQAVDLLNRVLRQLMQ